MASHILPKFPFYSFLFHLFPFLFLANQITPTKISPTNYLPYYSKHCNDVVPELPLTGSHPDFIKDSGDKLLPFEIAYLAGGETILDRGSRLSFHPKRESFSFTSSKNVLFLQANLRFFQPSIFRTDPTWKGRNLREIRFRSPRIPVRSAFSEFELYGFWDSSHGKLCMVGSGGVSSYDVGLKLKYPVKFSDFRSLISGVLESLDDKGSSGFFEHVSILGVPHFGEYKYSLTGEGNGSVCVGGDNGEEENLHLELGDPSSCLNQLYSQGRLFELEYGRECGSGGLADKCSPLGVGSGDLPKYMTIKVVRCEHGGAIQLLIGFSSTAYFAPGVIKRDFDPNSMLIGEGVWDVKKDRLCVVACRVLDFKEKLVNASVGDCSTRLSLRLPITLTITNRSSVVGRISSNKTSADTGYFPEIGFRGFGNRKRGLRSLKYKYTVIDRVSKLCPSKKTSKVIGRSYPYANLPDMRFDMLVTDGKMQMRKRGYSSPLFVGDEFYAPYRNMTNHNGLVNISYTLGFSRGFDFKFPDKVSSNDTVEISAEGTYDSETGILCMLGCRHLTSDIEKSSSNVSVDCEILINVQFSPLNGRSSIKGTIKSMRVNSDPLYFEQLQMSSNSMYFSQASKSIWRMDMEITIVLISSTLACVFVGLQLHHVKRHPDVLPSISFVMLAVLTIGHMVPLLLNFEALFKAHNRRDIVMGSDGWLEVNEITVRLVTMVAFLLEFRLLQLAWSARQCDGSHKSLWLSEKRVLYLSLPLFIGGVLIGLYVHEWNSYYKSRSPYLGTHHVRYLQSHPWGYFKAYAGLVLDSFLLPQIFFNLFLNSNEKALAPIFYVGTTVVRLLPHAYDLYRAHTSTQYFDWSYIYANHRQDFYSTSWDIVIPIFGVMFAVLIYLQQRFGGRCMLPKRFREISAYEKVPVRSSEDQPEESTH